MLVLTFHAEYCRFWVIGTTGGSCSLQSEVRVLA